MKKRAYLIPSLLAAGFVAPHEAIASIPALSPDNDDGVSPLFHLLQADRPVVVSGHASHASHSSHASHASSSGGGYIPRLPPIYTAPIAPTLQEPLDTLAAIPPVAQQPITSTPAS